MPDPHADSHQPPEGGAGPGPDAETERTLRQRVAELEAELARWRTWRPPGHYFSPFADPADVAAHADTLFRRDVPELPAVDLNLTRQQELMETFQRGGFYAEQPFAPEKQPGLRYFFDNDQFSYSDGLFLYLMLRHIEPRRIVEVGSGYSSCLMLDVNERHFDRRMELTFIEPFTERLLSNLRPGDRESIRLVARPVQEVALEEFTRLEAGDILFIDSTHVSRIGSDVNHLLFEVLPRLQPGVWVHFHDIVWPFEYPREWVDEQRAWTEAYLLRAFLMFNDAFRIQLCNTYLETFHEAWFREHMPLCLRDPGGSLWLRREGVG